MESLNPFHERTGADRLKNPFLAGSILVMAIGIGFVIARGGFTIASALMALPVIVYALNRVIAKPEIGLTFAFIINFLLMGVQRYVPIKMGYLMDITEIVIYVAIFFHYFDKKLNITSLKSDLIILSLIWFLYICLEFFNPEAISKTAWFSAFRGIAFYMILTIPLVYLLYNSPKHLDKFLTIWGVFSILAGIKGWIQLNIGVDPWEQRWLDEVGGITHIIWGNLRAFSFYTDAGQFGAAQGQIGLIGAIMMMSEKNFKKRLFWIAVMITGFYGMSASGTRGAIFVPMGGLALYIILRKNFKVILIGTVVMIIFYSFMRFTTLGNSNYQIYRMRTAFVPEQDASYLVRIKNQRLFQEYLKTRPFGGGIGHAGDRAQAYTPGTFLSSVATDSWFVLIWAECGIIGLYLHLFILGYIIGKGCYICMVKIRDPELLVKISALLCGIFGIMVASYGNAVLGQFPTGLLIYASMAYVFLAPGLDQMILEQKSNTIS
ncbi:MAG: O-antigen ligase domain-containing protein [Bacteroidales bacterium]|nr:O-antigen ligase domain-containing protein [Bacteroidales bacterium]HNW73400.1 O-antigen ligase domain-containing protein [Bacteroidales bacterium]HPS50772.1 O-antigen ligase domain-containing protein [Bacteroidales bacterium]